MALDIGCEDNFRHFIFRAPRGAPYSAGSICLLLLPILPGT